MRQTFLGSIASVLAVAAIALGILWLGPRPVYELWTVEELDGPARDSADGGAPRSSSAPRALPELSAVDFDGDGDDDLVHRDPGRGIVTHYENRGAAGPAPIPRPETKGNHAPPRPGSRGRGRSLTWEEAQSRTEGRSPLRPEWSQGGLFFDADRDGDVDVVYPERQDGGDVVTLRFYMQLELGYRDISPRLGSAWTTPREVSDLVCGDFDADGLIDIALARPGAPPLVLWNRFARP